MVDFIGFPGVPEEKRKSALGYVRVAAATDVESADAQRAILEGYAISHALTMEGLHVDLAASGSAGQSTPALAELLRQVENNPGRYAAVLVSEISSLSRSVAEYEALTARFKEAGVTLVSISEARRLEDFLEGVRQVFSELEWERHSGNIRRGIQHRKERDRKSAGQD